ncbi:MAG: hypothetical protein IJ575_03925 [Selenomonadaceae bacterium]|nr:hypothetical protein [Selenomonadaceae bacterium]
MKADRNQVMEVDSEEEELREILDDLLDASMILDRTRNFDWDDESNFVTREEIMARYGITEEDLAKVGEVRFE